MIICRLLERLINFIFRIIKRKSRSYEEEESASVLGLFMKTQIDNPMFANLKVSKSSHGNHWTVKTDKNIDAYKFFIAMTRACSAVSSHSGEVMNVSAKLPSPMGVMKLREYSYPLKSRMRTGQSDEVLFARIIIMAECKIDDRFRIDFYKPAAQPHY